MTSRGSGSTDEGRSLFEKEKKECYAGASVQSVTGQYRTGQGRARRVAK